MSYRCFEVESDAGVAHLRMCRPEEFNSFSLEFWQELPEIVEGLDADGGTRAIVLSSSGRHFSAGMDLSVFQTPMGSGGEKKTDPARQRADIRLMILKLQDVMSCLEKARMPVLAAIQGGCIGGGVDLVTACDMRYCTADAFFCIQEINLGIVADVGTLQRLPKVISEGAARELAYTGRRMPAQRALDVGLVNAVYETHEAMVADVLAMAQEIAERSPLAVWGTKEMLNYARDHSVADSLNYIATWQTGVFPTPDMAEAFRAKKEKRTPVYQDLLPKSKGL